MALLPPGPPRGLLPVSTTRQPGGAAAADGRPHRVAMTPDSKIR